MICGDSFVGLRALTVHVLSFLHKSVNREIFSNLI